MMKKFILTLFLPLLTAMVFSACGGQAAVESSAETGIDSAADESAAPADAAAAAPSSGTPGTYTDLQDWLANSGDVALISATANHSLASAGITLDITADGNTLIYEYRLPDDSWIRSLSEEELAAAFTPMADSVGMSVDSIFSAFSEQYSLSIDAVRLLCRSQDGTELYRRDFLP